MTRLGLLFKRLRHGKGFGIHSPFAYRFITETLRQPCSYYAYGSLPQGGLSDGEWRLLVRLLVHFRPGRVTLGEGLPKATGRFIRAVCPRVTFGDHGDLLLACGDVPEEYAAMVQKGDMHAIVLNSKSMPDAGAREHGMVFGNGRMWVMCAHPHLPSQNFDVHY